ncbi:MAG: UDP-N-acetylglucosamine 1-carboxyvinyltransferase [Ruminococcaceae bacterium]|nr:UDP-N-acetylglucosamine 1-carboxyvinyltransferase [Oscillospiraceae bacterium]
MSRLVIEGGHPLHGSIPIHGAKNAVLPILAATVLCSNGVSIIENCPELKDVAITIEILKELGAKVARSGSTLTIDARGRLGSRIPERLMRELRSSVIFMGAIVARKHKAKISMPGGCELGPRPIDLHIKALEGLGCSIKEQKGYLHIDAHKLHATQLTLDFPSVGATENIMLASCLSEGVTVVENVAQEPEIVDLANFLNAMGAKIRGAGSPRLEIEGVRRLFGTSYRIMPDRIAAVTYLCCGAVTGGSITLTEVIPAHIETALSVLSECGCQIETTENSIRLQAPARLRAPALIKTTPYPGFPTDAQSLFLALLCTTEGTGKIQEQIFKSRFKPVSELIKMGAVITVENDTAVITGVPALSGTKVFARDLRGGAALVIAGLGATGITEVENVCYIDRGYEKLEENLTRLGAVIQRKE